MFQNVRFDTEAFMSCLGNEIDTLLRFENIFFWRLFYTVATLCSSSNAIHAFNSLVHV